MRKLPWPFGENDTTLRKAPGPHGCSPWAQQGTAWAARRLTWGLWVSQSMAWTAAVKCPPLCRCWCVGSDLALPLLLVPDDPPLVAHTRQLVSLKLALLKYISYSCNTETESTSHTESCNSLKADQKVSPLSKFFPISHWTIWFWLHQRRIQPCEQSSSI